MRPLRLRVEIGSTRSCKLARRLPSGPVHVFPKAGPFTACGRYEPRATKTATWLYFSAPRRAVTCKACLAVLARPLPDSLLPPSEATMNRTTRDAKVEAAAQAYDLATSRWTTIHALCAYNDPAVSWGLAELASSGLALARTRAPLLGFTPAQITSGASSLALYTRAEFAAKVAEYEARQARALPQEVAS